MARPGQAPSLVKGGYLESRRRMPAPPLDLCSGGQLKIITPILERPVTETTLSHLGLYLQPSPECRCCEPERHQLG